MGLYALNDGESMQEYAADTITRQSELNTLNSTTPILDITSPDFIEQRLENLKRKQSWVSWLDQYVEEYSDSDYDEDYQDNTKKIYRKVPLVPVYYEVGFLRTIFWSTTVILFTPFWIVWFPCLHLRRRNTKWPMNCSSLVELYLHSLLSIIALVSSGVLVYWSICREFPSFDLLAIQNQLEFHIQTMINASFTCYYAWYDPKLKNDSTTIQEICTPIAVDAAFVAIPVILFLYFHKKWAKYCIVFFAGVLAMNGSNLLINYLLPQPYIYNIDPSYALQGEEVRVAVIGYNLKTGGTVAWVAYWGCKSLKSTPLKSCEMHSPSRFELGMATVVLDSIDNFIPCYRDPPNPLQPTEYRCFEHIQLRVKNKHSIPGWSKVKMSNDVRQELQELESTPAYSETNSDLDNIIEVEMGDHGSNGIAENQIDNSFSDLKSQPEEARTDTVIEVEQEMIEPNDVNEKVYRIIMSDVQIESKDVDSDAVNKLKEEIIKSSKLAAEISGISISHIKTDTVEAESTYDAGMHVEPEGTVLDEAATAEKDMHEPNELATEVSGISMSDIITEQDVGGTDRVIELEQDMDKTNELVDQVEDISMSDMLKDEKDIGKDNIIEVEQEMLKPNDMVEKVTMITTVQVKQSKHSVVVNEDNKT